MTTRSNVQVSRPSFFVDEHSIDRAHGHQFDWAKVGTAFINPETGKKEIPAGTLIVEADDGSNKVWPRTNETGALTTTMILSTNAIESEKEAALSGYGFVVGGVIYVNLLPDYSHPDFETWWNELIVTGTGWSRQAYVDDRVS